MGQSKIKVVKEPVEQESNKYEELSIATSIMRREGINPKVFSYKKSKEDEL